MSGGQRQAIAIARSTHSDAKILLLDEPLAAMGAREGALIIELIEELRKRSDVSMIVIAHNYVHVLEMCDRVNLLRNGRIMLDKRDGRDLGRGADRDRRRRVPAAEIRVEPSQRQSAAATRTDAASSFGNSGYGPNRSSFGASFRLPLRCGRRSRDRRAEASVEEVAGSVGPLDWGRMRAPRSWQRSYDRPFRRRRCGSGDRDRLVPRPSRTRFEGFEIQGGVLAAICACGATLDVAAAVFAACPQCDGAGSCSRCGGTGAVVDHAALAWRQVTS